MRLPGLFKEVLNLSERHRSSSGRNQAIEA
jgi:hypothetical protein